MAVLSARVRHFVPALVGLLALSATSGCTSSDSDAGPAAACGTGTSHGCFDLSSYGNLYCTVPQTRAWLDAGRLLPTDLPAWADLTSREGSTMVFDFRHPPTSDPTGAQYTQELLNSLHQKNLLVDSADLEQRDDCLDDLTQQKVADTEGGWPPA